jgi:hypothetical protein
LATTQGQHGGHAGGHVPLFTNGRGFDLHGQPLENSLENSLEKTPPREDSNKEKVFARGLSSEVTSDPAVPGVSKGPTRPGLPRLLRGDALRRLDAELAMVVVAVDRPLAEGERIESVLPGQRREVWVERADDDSFDYHCDCDLLRRSLTEVYISRVTGVKRTCTRQEYVQWTLRRAAKARLIKLPRSPLPPPVAGVLPAPVEMVYRGLCLHLQVRQLTELRNESTFTFSVPFAADWCGVSSDQAKQAIARLRKDGVLVVVDRLSVGGGGRANRYRLGGPSDPPGAARAHHRHRLRGPRYDLERACDRDRRSALGCAFARSTRWP